MPTENDGFSHVQFLALTNKEQIVNYVAERITRFEEQIGRRPDHRDPLNADAFQRWRDMCLVWLGRVAECTSLLGSLQLLPPEEALRLKMRALALINRALESIVMGA
jgi:hypothetical protein